MKKFISLFLATVMILTLAACNGADPSEGTPTPTPVGSETQTPEPVTIKFANYALLEAGYEEFWNGVKAGFEAKYDHITIEWVTAPYNEMVTQVINMAGGGEKVDLIFGEIGWTPTFEDAGLSVPVDEVLSQEFLNDFYPDLLTAHSINGKPYGIPLYVSPYVLYYNKDLFEAAGLDPETPPTTYDEMLVMAEELAKLTTDDGNKVFAFGQATSAVPISGAALTSVVYNFGGEVLTLDGQLNVDTPAFKQAFEMIKLLNEKGYNPQNAYLKDLRNLFALGQLAMYYDQSWGFNGVASINPEARNFTASAAPLKGGDGDGESILQSHSFILLDNGAARKEAVRLLVEYVITPEVLNDYLANITPAYPSRISMKDIEAVVESSVLKGAAASVEKAVPSAFIPELAQLNIELTTLAQSVTVGGMSVDDAIANFKSAVSGFVD